jgi:sugar phosphate isomerase/epimerase
MKASKRNILFATMPYQEVQRNLNFLESNRLGVEIATHDTNWLLNIFKESIARRLGEDIRSRGIIILSSGPIFDMNPGSLDHVVRRHTEDCFVRALDLARSLDAPSLVLPSGFNPLLPDESVEGWKELSIETWIRVGEAARKRGIRVLIKNIFDHSPDIIMQLMEALDGLPFGICLDVGHVNVYSSMPTGKWLRAFGPQLHEIHLHDNLGTSDDHLTMGGGIIDFKSVFRDLTRKYRSIPLTLDMEMTEITKSLDYIDRLDLLGMQLNLL